MRAIASQADQAIKSKAIVSLHCPAGQIDGLAVGQRHAMRFFTAGAQDRTTGGENARDVLQVQHAGMVFNQSRRRIPASLSNGDPSNQPMFLNGAAPPMS